jgi:Flp pilus assembly protein TadD
MNQKMKIRSVASACLAVAVALSLAAPTFAQESLVEGIVVDRDGKPVADVRIVFSHKSQGNRFTVKSNTSGRFMKVGMPLGLYAIAVEADGFIPLGGDVNVDVGRNQGLKLVLERVPVQPKHDPDLAEGTRLFQAGQFKEALPFFQKAADRTPDNVEANYALALSLLRSGEVEGAIARFEKVRTMKPEMVEAYLALGEAYFAKGESEKALTFFDRALELQPNSAEVHYNIGLIHYKNNETEKAIQSFSASLSLDPKFAATYYQLGLAHIKQGKMELAVTNLEKYLELQPNAPQAAQVRTIIDQIKK